MLSLSFFEGVSAEPFEPLDKDMVGSWFSVSKSESSSAGVYGRLVFMGVACGLVKDGLDGFVVCMRTSVTARWCVSCVVRGQKSSWSKGCLTILAILLRSEVLEA